MNFKFRKVSKLLLCGIISAILLQPTAIAKAANNDSKVKIADGWYYLKNTLSQKYLTVTGNKAEANANVEIYSKAGLDGQKWKVTNTSDGYITLTNGLGNFMLDVANGENKDGANIALYHAYSGDPQKFVVMSTQTANVCIIGTKVSNATKMIDVFGQRQDDGTNVCQWSYNGNPNQQWIFEPVTGGNTQPTQPTQPTGGCVIPKCDVDKNGPFAVTVDKGCGPNRKGLIVRPTNPGTNGVTKHPIFIWNPGGGDQPSLYEGQMRRWASQGFVVYSEESQWSGKQCVDALNWIIQQNSNPQFNLYNKLDVTRIAAGGFSLGSVGAYSVASDSRIKTTIHCDGGSFDGSGAGKWRNPTCVMNGLSDGGLASNNTNRDYDNARVPIWYGGIIGGGHGSTVWDGSDAITGWLRWQVAGDKDMANMFLTQSGRFNNGKFKSRWKNWQ